MDQNSQPTDAELLQAWQGAGQSLSDTELLEAAKAHFPNGLPQGPAATPGASPALAEQAQPASLQDRAQEVFGFDKDIVRRGTIVPYGVTKEGETELAVPQIGVDLLTSAIAPGEALRGTPITHEDATRFTLDALVPAAAAGRTAPAIRPSKMDFIAAAPSSEAIKAEGRAKFGSVKSGGQSASADSYADFLAGLETKLATSGADPVLHPKMSAAFNAISKRIGDDVDIEGLLIARRQLGTAAKSIDDDERRLAEIALESFDDYVDNITQSMDAREARSIWARAKKTQVVEELMERAQLAAGGLEKGLVAEFRSLLKNPKRLRGFSETERQAMRRVVDGGPVRAALRLLGKSSLESGNILGLSAGTGLGAYSLGAPGAIAAPIIGSAARRGATASTQNAAEMARALVATGKPMPSHSRLAVPSTATTAGATAGAQLESGQRYQPLVDALMRRLLPLGAPVQAEMPGGRLAKALMQTR